MAIGLDDTRKKKVVPKQQNEIQKKAVIRPWGSFDQLQGDTRTLSAKEAVVSAQAREQNRSKEIKAPSSFNSPIREKRVSRSHFIHQSQTGLFHFFRSLLSILK